jgi:hypothetical protein|tara:strand:+ start:708 stop:875 length:168 start_codon:yes stop_codon:yes gene_type:complete
MRWLMACLLLALLSPGMSSCAYMKGDKEVNTDPDPGMPGPGIFTGRTGEWVIINK